MKWILIFTAVVCFDQAILDEVQSINKRNASEFIEYVLLNQETHPCARKCAKNSTSMTCRYTFHLEWYQTMSKACYNCPFNETDCFREDCIPADGGTRSVAAVNRQIPGPSVEVCLGDEVIVDVINSLGTESTAIHWHGHHQKNSPYMDGVPFITQCPILAGTNFRYNFHVKNAGTHFWHSHIGFQRSDGVFGTFVVREPEEDNPHANLYDYDLSEHSISILDWTTQTGNDKFLSHMHNAGNNKPDTILVNGLGRFHRFNKDNETFVTPTARFTIQQGYRYRFRLINAGFLNCPIEVSIDNHTLTVISSDGSDFNATEVKSLVSYAGERFDFIINANQEKDVYWLKFKGLMDCDERFTKAFQLAVLEYKGATQKYPNEEPTYDTIDSTGKQMNPLNKGTELNTTDYVTMSQLHSLDNWDETLKEKADFQYYVSYDFYKMDHPKFHKAGHYGFFDVQDTRKRVLMPQLNYISMANQNFPLLSQRHQIAPGMFCNESSVENCEKDFCECTHVVEVPLNTIVEMVLIDKGYAYDANHPFHLHGHSFRVVAMERVSKHVNVSDIRQLDLDGKIKRNLVDAPVKDTVTVPDGGYTVIRFKADNPGYWLFHCHIEFHVEVGMALVFKIGDHREMPKVPFNFPTCGNYVPDDQIAQDCDNVGTFAKFWQKIWPDHSNCVSSNGNKLMSFNLIFLLVLSVILS